MDYGTVVRAILFALFAALAAALTAVIGPTYDGLLVPQLAPSVAYAAWSGGNVFATGVNFSNTLLVELVDPAAVLVIAVVGILYLVRAVMPSPKLAHLAPRLIIGVLVANFVLPITSALWQVSAAIYPVFYGLGGGAWQSYGNLVGPGALSFSWDNGAVAFVVSLVLFSMVLMLAFLVAFRTALLAVLLVLLPPLTLLWAIPAAAPIARKAWTLFVEMTFLPGLLIVPLALAVGAPSILLTLGFFSVALAMPQILSAAGHSASQMGLPSAGNIVAGGLADGARTGSQNASGFLRSGSGGLTQGMRQGWGGGSGGAQATGRAAGGSSGSAGSAAAGPAGVVVWGMNEGIGSLTRELGARAGRGLGRTSAKGSLPDQPKGSGGGDGERPHPPPPAPKDHQIAGFGGNVPRHLTPLARASAGRRE